MARIPDRYEDWTPPWGEGEFDADQAAKIVYAARLAEQKAIDARKAIVTEKAAVDSELAAAQQQLSKKPEDEASKDAEISALRTKVEALEKNGRDDDRDLIARYEVAMEHGLTAKDAKRLVGKTPEELAEDAEEFATRLGLKKDDDGGAPPPPRRLPDQLPGDGRDRSGDQNAVLSVDQLRKEKQEGRVSLPPLGR